MHLFADGDDDLLPLFDGTRARVASTGDAQVLSHAIGGGRDRPRARRRRHRVAARRRDDPALRGVASPRTRGVLRALAAPRSLACAALDRGVRERTPTRTFLEMAWTEAGQTGGLLLDEPLDLSTDRLELRTIVDPRTGRSRLQVRITDANGDSDLLDPVLLAGGLPALRHRQAVGAGARRRPVRPRAST